MTIKIVLPEGEGVKMGYGTKVYTDQGHEINDIVDIKINIKANDIINAVITVPISLIENFEGVDGLVVGE